MRAKEAFYTTASALACICASMPVAAQEQPSTARGTIGESVTSDTNESGDIIVTASKRSERLRDVPSAITALSGDALQNVGAVSFRDYATLVPGLNQNDAGAPGYGTIILRGLYTGNQQTTNTTAVMLDEALFTSSGFYGIGTAVRPEPELADIERIEVLKGPQGTLYGASSLGGLIVFVTKKPDATRFQGSIAADATTVDGGGEGFGVRGSINVPLVTDRLAIRATGFYRRSPGYVDNVGTGTKNVNTSDSEGARIALRWTPTEALKVDLSALYQNSDSIGYAYQENASGTTIPLYGRDTYKSIIDGKTKVRYRVVSGAIDYDLGPVSLVTTASYVKSTLGINQDFTTEYGPLFPIPNFGVIAPGGPELEKYTIESRLVSKRLGAFEFVAGGFYTHEKNRYAIQLIGVDSRTAQPITGPFAAYANLVTSDTRSTYEEVAAFANVTFYLNDQLDVTGGLRYARNSQKSRNDQSGALLPTGSSSSNFAFDDDRLTYLGTIRWRPSDRISLFARAASGYRPGGIQTIPPTITDPKLLAIVQPRIKADTVWNYEAGIKSTLLPNNSLDLSASVFHIDWTDIQLNSLIGGFTLQGNAGAAKIDGFEIEATARPGRYTTISTNVGYTRARITKIDPSVSAAIGAAKGDTLPFNADWTAAVIADQKIPLSDTVEAGIGATLRFESDKPSSYPGSVLATNVKIPSITTLDLRAGVKFGKYSVQLLGQNILNEQGFTTLSTSNLFPGQGAPTKGAVIRPRSFTVALRADF